MQERRNRWWSIVVIIVNVLLIAGLIVVFVAYENDYKQQLFAQNVDDISNINQSSANISSSFFSARENKLRDLALYIEQRGLTLEESLDYIRSTNADPDKDFEILDSAYRGYRIEHGAKANIPVDYSNGYGNMSKQLNAFTTATDSQIIRFAPEFTDAYTAMKCFALYTYVAVSDGEGGKANYALMIVEDSMAFAKTINLDGGYDDLSTAIVDSTGNYIIGNTNFKSDNFFKYLYVFNDLSLDEQNAIAAQVSEQGRGSVQYKDSRERDCVFVYAEVPDKEWYCITAVPIARFHNRSFDISFTVVIVIMLLFLLAVDFLYLYTLNRRLRVSVANEKVASAAKTDFLSRMSHDIRTPLNVIIGMTMMAQNEANPPETKQCLKNIDESGKFLLGLVNDILDLNKVESGKMELHPEPYSFEEFRSHINAVVGPLCRDKGIQFVMKGSMAGQYVMLDRLRVNQVFFNLLSNAVKFTPKGGLIQLICNARMLDEQRVAFDFEVRDNGIGMSLDFQKHMFEAFSQESRKETVAIQGTGLGLAIVANLVSLMGGTLRVESAPGEGTSFFVHVETVLAEEQVQKQESALNEQLLVGRRILLCEDHPLNAQIAIKILEKKQMITDHASDGEKGVEMFKASAPNYYDAILMDIRMPVMNGMEATRAIRGLNRSDARIIPIIAMTANAYDIDRQNSFEAGMNAHIAKPIDTKLLYTTLEEQIAQRECAK